MRENVSYDTKGGEMAKKVKQSLDLTGQKGTLCDRCLKVLSQARADVIFNLFEGKTLTGKIKGIGQYTILVDVDGEDILIFKHAINYLERVK